MNLPFSQACENNKQPIVDVLEQYLSSASGTVLEVGSCTAQHVVFFAQQFKNLQWQPSDVEGFLAGIEARLQAEGGDNILAPFALDVTGSWPSQLYDFCFTANTCHIMPEEHVADFFEGVASCLKPGGLFFIYGPFKYHGKYTSDSNARFEEWLKSQNSYSGIRDIEYINVLADKHVFKHIADHKMPANNQLLVFEKGGN